MMDRREWLARVGVGVLGVLVLPRMVEGMASPPLAAGVKPIPIKVYKSASCGCCKSWVTYIDANGFKADVSDLDESALQAKKAALGVPEAMHSCHTAVVGKYLVEGHVPADLIHRLLRERPAALGLAVPGMVVGSPGMEGGTPQHYDVMLFKKDGSARVYVTR